MTTTGPALTRAARRAAEPGTGPALTELVLPTAPRITRGTAAPVRRPKLPAGLLLGLGVLLVLAPIVGGMFSKVAAGKQLIDEFKPHLEADALARYDHDLAILRAGAAGVDEVYREQAIPAGRFPGLDQYRATSAQIDRRSTDLLDRVVAAEPDYRTVAGIGGFDRVPFLIVAAGIVAIYGGCLLLAGTRERARSAAALVVLAGVALALSPLVDDLPNGTRAGDRMLHALEPVMTHQQVRQLQDDFVVLVQADGELDTGFRQVPQTGPAAASIATLVQAWPTVSSDFAGLVGTINDNIDNYDALGDLDALTSGIGVSGLTALPWLLVGVGVATAGLSIAARPRRWKDT